MYNTISEQNLIDLSNLIYTNIDNEFLKALNTLPDNEFKMSIEEIYRCFLKPKDISNSFDLLLLRTTYLVDISDAIEKMIEIWRAEKYTKTFRSTESLLYLHIYFIGGALKYDLVTTTDNNNSIRDTAIKIFEIDYDLHWEKINKYLIDTNQEPSFFMFDSSDKVTILLSYNELKRIIETITKNLENENNMQHPIFDYVADIMAAVGALMAIVSIIE